MIVALSVYGEAAEGHRFKLLFEDSVGEEEFNAVMALFLEFLEAYYAERLEDNLAQELRDIPVVGRTILIAYDPEQRVLRVINPTPTKKRE